VLNPFVFPFCEGNTFIKSSRKSGHSCQICLDFFNDLFYLHYMVFWIYGLKRNP
jgi:hypothetical protein